MKPLVLDCATCGTHAAWGAGYFDDHHQRSDEDGWVHTCITCEQAMLRQHDGDTDWHLTQLVRESERLGLYGDDGGLAAAEVQP